MDGREGNQVKRESIAMGIDIAGPDRRADSRIGGRRSEGGPQGYEACKANPGEQASWNQPGQRGGRVRPVPLVRLALTAQL